MLGRELFYSPLLGSLERWYCFLFGVPIVGLRIRLRKVAKLLPDQASHVLDAGCGRGVISRYLAKRYISAQVTALDTEADLQGANTVIAQNQNLVNCKFIVGDLLEYHRPDAHDLIVSVDNLEHIDKDEQVLNNFYDSMLPGGVLLVHVPHYYRRWPVFHKQVNFDVPGHVRPGYRMSELVEKVEKPGFQVLDKGFSYGFLENLVNNISYAITGAREQNKVVYALAFPFLNMLAWMGQWGRPGFGAGVWVVAEKPGIAFK